MSDRFREISSERSKPREKPHAEKASEQRETQEIQQNKVQEKKREAIEHSRARIHNACTPLKDNKKSAKKEPSKIVPKVDYRDIAEKQAAEQKRKEMLIKIGDTKKIEQQIKISSQRDYRKTEVRPVKQFGEGLKINVEINREVSKKTIAAPVSIMHEQSKVRRSCSTEEEIKNDQVDDKNESDIRIDQKTCPNCNRDLPLDRFEKYGGDRGKKPGLQQYRSVCRDCRRLDDGQKKLIYGNTLKTRAIREIFGGKCIDCGIGLEVLPALEFDHHDPSLKEISWRTTVFHSLEEIRQWKEKENIELRCGNCHMEKHAFIFEKYRDLIMKKDLFLMQPAEIDRFLQDSLTEIRREEIKDEREKPENATKREWEITDVHHIKSNVEAWIRKRYVVEALYNGKCCGCGTDVKNLPSIEFHHINPELKDIATKWHEIWQSDDAVKFLLDEECIGICGNCHGVLESKYLDSWEFVSNRANIPSDEAAQIKSRTLERLNTIQLNIEKYRDKLPLLKKQYEEGKLKMPIRRDFKIGENHLRILIKINHFTELRENSFYKDLLGDSFETKSFPEREFQKLLKLGYIASDDDKEILQKNYYITQEGFTVINDFKAKNHEIFEKLKGEVKDPEFAYNPEKRIDGDPNKLRVYSNVLFNMINEKGHNEFTPSDIRKAFQISKVQTSRIIQHGLIPNQLIEYIGHPAYYNLEGCSNAYKLTQKAIDIAIKEPNNQNKLTDFNKPDILRIKNRQLIMMIMVYYNYMDKAFTLKEFHQSYYPSVEFGTFKTYFYIHVSNYGYVNKIAENTYTISDNGKSFVQYFLKNNKIINFTSSPPS